MSDELVERLRNYDEFEQDRDGQIICQKCEITHEAADRIEQLERELSISRMAQVVMDNGAEALTAERDKYESAWMTAEGKLEDAVQGLEKCQAELDAYSRQEYPLDHSVHERYRQRDYDANPARITLAALKGKNQ